MPRGCAPLSAAVHRGTIMSGTVAPTGTAGVLWPAGGACSWAAHRAQQLRGCRLFVRSSRRQARAFCVRCAGFQQLLQFPALRSPSRSPTMRTRPSPVGSHSRSSPKRRSNVYANFSFGSHSERCSPGVHKTGLLFRVIPSLCSSRPRPRPRLTQRRHPRRMQCRRRWRTTRATSRTCSATLPI